MDGANEGTYSSVVGARRPRAPAGPRTSSTSPRQRVGPQLHLHGPGAVRGATLQVEHGAGAVGGPQALALPARVRIVDPAVDVLREEAHRIRHGERDQL